MAARSKLNDTVTVEGIPDEQGRRTTRQMTRQDMVMELVRQGCTQKVAAVRAGISESSFYSWRDKGRKAKSGQYHDFAQALEEAQAVAEATLTLQLRAHGSTEWRAVAWMLERRFPDTWRERKSLDTTLAGPAGTPVQVVHQLADMDPEQLAALAGNDLAEMDDLRLPTAVAAHQPVARTTDEESPK